MKDKFEGVYAFDHGPYGAAIATVECVTRGEGVKTTYLVSFTWQDDEGQPDIFQMWQWEEQLPNLFERDGYIKIDDIDCLVLNEEDFDKLYTYDKRVKSANFPEDYGRLETFGSDLGRVRAQFYTDQKRIWTMVDGDDGMYLCAGMRQVNRIYYVITKERWERDDEEYLIQKYDEDLTEDENHEVSSM